VAGTSAKSPATEVNEDVNGSEPPKKSGFADLEVAGGEDDDDQDNFMVRAQSCS